MNCPRCGADVPTLKKYCPQCGENVGFLQKLSAPLPLEEKPREAPDNESISRIQEFFRSLRPVSEVRDEAWINKIRLRFAAWVQENNRQGLEHFKESLRLQKIFEIQSYHLVFESTVEERGPLKEGKKLYGGEPIPPTPLLKQAVKSIWDISLSSDVPEDDKTIEWIIPESFRKQKCLDCMGRPPFFCEACRGKKTILCPECSGRGKKKCTGCKGSGTVRCTSCAGKGTTAAGDSTGIGARCVDCLGGGTVPCTQCVKGFVPCTVCGEEGSVVCPKCKGEGVSVCGGCQGKGEMLLYLSFDVSRSKTIGMDFAAHPSLPAHFPVKKLKEQRPDKEQYVSVSRFPDRTGMSRADEVFLVKPIEDGIAAIHKKIKTNTDKRITGEILRVRIYVVWKGVYTFNGKEYYAFFYGNPLSIYQLNDPLRDVRVSWAAEARDYYKQGAWDKAQECIDRIEAGDPGNREALAVDQQMKLTHRLMQSWWGLLGGLTAGGVVAGFIVSVRFRSINLWGPLIAAFVVCLCMGAGIGFIAGYATSRKRPIQIIRRRIPYFAALSGVLSFFIFIIFIVRYDPIRRKDTEDFLMEYHTALPYGVPTVPWDKDIESLKRIIRKYYPTGIDITKAVTAYKRLKDLKEEKIRKQKEEEALKARKQAKNRQKSIDRQRRIRYQKSFNKDMETFETMVIKRKLRKAAEKKTYLQKIINTYKNKGIDINRAYREMKRIKQ